MAENIPSIFGEPVWTEADALRTREFFNSPTGVRLARAMLLNAPCASLNAPENSDRLVGLSAGYRQCMSFLDHVRIIPGTRGTDGELLPEGIRPSALPDLDLPVGDPAWGGVSDPAAELVDLPIETPER